MIGILSVIDGFPAQRDSNVENISILWRHNDMAAMDVLILLRTLLLSLIFWCVFFEFHYKKYNWYHGYGWIVNFTEYACIQLNVPKGDYNLLIAWKPQIYLLTSVFCFSPQFSISVWWLKSLVDTHEQEIDPTFNQTDWNGSIVQWNKKRTSCIWSLDILLPDTSTRRLSFNIRYGG